MPGRPGPPEPGAGGRSPSPTRGQPCPNHRYRRPDQAGAEEKGQGGPGQEDGGGAQGGAVHPLPGPLRQVRGPVRHPRNVQAPQGSLPLLPLLPGGVRRLSPDYEKGEESPFYWHNREWVALWQILGRLPAGHEILRRVPGIHRPGAGGGVGPVSWRPRPRSVEVGLLFSAHGAVGLLENFHGKVEGCFAVQEHLGMTGAVSRRCRCRTESSPYPRDAAPPRSPLPVPGSYRCDALLYRGRCLARDEPYLPPGL